MAFIPNRDVVTVLGNEIADKYSSIEQIVWRRNAQGVFHCKTPDCENAVFVDDKSIEWTCELCKKKFCIKCQVEYHDKLTCEAYQKWKAENDKGDELLDELVKKGVLKKCKCGKIIERNGGCNQITCTCGLKFCWECLVFLQKGDKCAHAWYH